MTPSLSQLAYFGVVAGVALQRLAELRISRRNEAWARERGAVEHGRGHYAPMVALHTALLLGCVLEVWWRNPPFQLALAAPMFALLVAAQLLRVWCVKSLGPYWNTRVLVVPDAPRIHDGPYAWLRHPNYLAVAVEGLALPLLHGAWLTAVLFSLANGWLLRVRMRCEDRVLPRTHLPVVLLAEDA